MAPLFQAADPSRLAKSDGRVDADQITLFELAVNPALLWDEQFKRVFGAQEKDAAPSP